MNILKLDLIGKLFLFAQFEFLWWNKIDQSYFKSSKGVTNKGVMNKKIFADINYTVIYSLDMPSNEYKTHTYCKHLVLHVMMNYERLLIAFLIFDSL
jgi:hypothetical protein